jgi:hypothetical protein
MTQDERDSQGVSSTDRPDAAEVQDHDYGGKTPSSAPNASLETGLGEGATGYDSPPGAGRTLYPVDPDVSQPYYPPGGEEDSEYSGEES